MPLCDTCKVDMEENYAGGYLAPLGKKIAGVIIVPSIVFVLALIGVALSGGDGFTIPLVFAGLSALPMWGSADFFFANRRFDCPECGDVKSVDSRF